jgi:hypothetical protein
MAIKRGFCFKERKLMSDVWKLCVQGNMRIQERLKRRKIEELLTVYFIRLFTQRLRWTGHVASIEETRSMELCGKRYWKATCWKGLEKDERKILI